MCRKVGNTFSTQKTRGKIVPAVVKLRHAKVVVRRHYSWKNPVACIRPAIASSGVCFRREDSLDKYRWCADDVFCCCCGP